MIRPLRALNETGTYQFTNLVAGEYMVRQKPPPGLLATYPTNYGAHTIQPLIRAGPGRQQFRRD